VSMVGYIENHRNSFLKLNSTNYFGLHDNRENIFCFVFCFLNFFDFCGYSHNKLFYDRDVDSQLQKNQILI